MAKITGPGSLNVDITGFAPRLPVMGETVSGRTIQMGPGGKGNNQMTAAHRAGAQTVLIGCRGRDPLGKVIEEHLSTEGMDTRFVSIRENVSTGGALIEVDDTDAQNRILVMPGANGTVGRAEVLAAEAEFADCDAVLTQFETTAEAVLASKELAHKYAKPFILNPAPCLPMPEGLYEGVDYLTPNETEAGLLTGITVESAADCRAAAEKLLAMGVKHVIITLGSRGVYYYDGETEITLPALPVKPVDTTGAGDAFNGGFAVAVAEGADIPTALRFATCTAALSVSRAGASSSMPYREEIDRQMQACCSCGPKA